MLTLNDMLCPICKQKAVEIAQNNFIKCSTHGWIQESVLEIEIPEEVYMKSGQQNKPKYNN